MRITNASIKNFRTLESVDLTFPSYYTAICGKNNAGKTNIVRALRTLLKDHNPFSPLPSRHIPEISYKEDFPAWKKREKSEETIDVSLSLTIDRTKDAGLFLFIEKIASIPSDASEITLALKRTVRPKMTQPRLSVAMNGTELDEFPAAEIVKKLAASFSILFYNSTEIDHSRYRFGRGIGSIVGNFATADREKFDKLQAQVDSFVAKITKKHQRDISDLLGKLEDKYTVGLTAPSLSLEYVPYDISLGHKNFSVPLDEWGSGTRNRTMILLALLRAKKASEADGISDRLTPVLLIEEPESFLHPSAQAEFGRLIQDLTEELEVQVILTTHSPYMLSLDHPGSNILLDRTIAKREYRETIVVETCGERWMEPFSLALGIDNAEFEPWKALLATRSHNMLLVEGEIDKEYFELLRDDSHGDKRLRFDGDIVPYDGKDALKNSALLRFVLSRQSRFFVTFDLDSDRECSKSLEALGLVRGKHFAAVGRDEPGKRDIEGMLPDPLCAKVYSANVSLVQGLGSNNADERKSHKNKLKRALLQEFKASSVPGTPDYDTFYKLSALINKALVS